MLLKKEVIIMKDVFAKLLSLKSIITLLLTIALVTLLFYPNEPNKEVLALFCTSYGAIITFFFTRKSKGDGE